MDRLRVGVIGLGWFGERHARVYSQLPNAELVAICDHDSARSAAVAARIGATQERDAHDLFARQDIDAVSICLPDRMHTDAALAAIAAVRRCCSRSRSLTTPRTPAASCAPRRRARHAS